MPQEPDHSYAHDGEVDIKLPELLMPKEEDVLANSEGIDTDRNLLLTPRSTRI